MAQQPRDDKPDRLGNIYSRDFTIHVDFRGRTMENRWTRYRAAKLEELGLSDWEIMALKYNKLSNPRVVQFLKDIREEVQGIAKAHRLTYKQATAYRREHFAQLVDNGEISEYDPYIRMGYWDE